MKQYPAADRPFTYAEQVSEWEHVPIEGEGGYVRSSVLLAEIDARSPVDGDRELRRRADVAAAARYSEDWRNPDNKWVRFLHEGAAGHVLDFGCGFGLESLQLVRRGCRVTLVDINESSTRLAARMITAHGLGGSVAATCVATDAAPYFESPAGPVDVFYSCGVLHHVPYPREILLRACELLAPGGEIRLMLYSDKGWEITTGSPCPPVDDDTSKNPLAPKFRASFDCVGRWADWYSAARLEHLFGDFLTVTEWEYLTRDGAFAAAKLVVR